MKNIKTCAKRRQPIIVSLSLVCLLGGIATAPVTHSADATPERIGVYDSRAVAYAYFWSEAHQRKLNEMADSARKAKNSGETERVRELQAALKAEQEQIHLQVFSTAPITNVLAAIKPRVEEIQRETQVTQLISKWEKAQLKTYSGAEKVDVTDRLLRDFKLDAKQRKVVEDIRSKTPLPLKKAAKLAKAGKL